MLGWGGVDSIGATGENSVGGVEPLVKDAGGVSNGRP